MRVSLEWLRDYVDITPSPSKLADILSMSGTSVERIEELASGVSGVIVGEVKRVENHPSSDRLRIAVTWDGKEEKKIVCGAPNLEVGMKVALALPGATFPSIGKEKLEKRVIRGIESWGMLLSGAELGISDDQSGILELPHDAPPGEDLRNYLSLDDVVFELEITPNRPDCMSMLGVAREIAALTGKKLSAPRCEVAESSEPAERLAKVEVENLEGCDRYTAKVITGVRVGPSPAWMQRRLHAVGLRSVNNVVDVTNYVMMELGQPLHAFDLNKVARKTIIVRNARPGEQLMTLDGVERQLNEKFLVIADFDEPIALAGIMGGEGTQVTDATTDVLLEAAHFNSVDILTASKRLGMRTDASSRFERGTDPLGTVLAARRAAALIKEVAGGEVAHGEIDISTRPIFPVEIELRTETVGRLLGLDISGEEIQKLLEPIELKVRRNGNVLHVEIPTFRVDLEREVDLVEEIARIYGYGRIPSFIPGGGGAKSGLTKRQKLENKVTELLISEGLSGVVAYSFILSRDLDLLLIPPGDRLRDCVAILNPLAETGELMRTTMLPGLMRVSLANMRRGNDDLAIFEKGRVFFSRGEQEHPLEIPQVGILLHGRREPLSWLEQERKFDFYDLKGMVENLIEGIGTVPPSFDSFSLPYAIPGRSTGVFLEGKLAGYLCQLLPEVVSGFGLSGDFYACELLLEELLDAANEEAQFKPFSRYPSVKVDVAFVVDDDLQSARLEDEIRRSGGDILFRVELFDVYKGPQLPPGKKSLAYSLQFSSPERTLTDEEVNSQLDLIIENAGKALGATIRGREQPNGQQS
ncbi:MAG: phenylalanine--tRNA ligase subunit beta [Actinomycetota bacterium]|nr:phenylalanine--tRNA ligase subunit beta [Actinomycetota bacterium]